ncbi:Helicase IV [Corynebacterium aquatimens]|uniref:DNA helicase IV n=2 Tax=Corynebacterium aquatimens TaxID=1190508 RepID=A0A931E0A8_9CORY|nr:DNA helicase IV [Corynebacterium aquatimens]WJY65950.1 Helicase IV [Corynebacterium aquatimens]
MGHHEHDEDFSSTTSKPVKRMSANDNAIIDEEQRYVDTLFAHLDQEVAHAQKRLADVQRDVDPENPDADALVRRETEYHGLNAKLDDLNVAETGLVFGRIDVEDPDPENPVAAPGGAATNDEKSGAATTNELAGGAVDRRYIGRMGLDDRADNYRTLLLDWRAPMARPYYLATTAHPEGVLSRRNIRMKGRTVTAVDDERLSGKEVVGESSISESSDVSSEAALRRAMNAPRTGYMQSIVETIQREQDEIIREPSRGVVVVGGGPGTGKTAVALHRVAYLMYTWREQLTRTGVLIVGPNRTFLDYISRVLPELGETGVVLSTVQDLVPGFRPLRTESLVAREVKGSGEMVAILKRAVQNLQTVPAAATTVTIDGIELDVTPAMIKQARTRARRSRKPHNLARPYFAEALTESIAQALAARIGEDPLGGTNLLSRADVDQLHDDLADDPQILALVDEHFPQLTPVDVLAGLLGSREAIAAAAFDYDDITQDALYREDATAWTPSDTALIDELYTLIGLTSSAEEKDKQEQQWRELVAEAEDALDILASSENTDNDDEFEAEILSAHDIIDAETLASRQRETDVRSTAQRAQSDMTWAYGHVIVDEAQELSPMEWRMVFRRCPARWMTLVGDPAQTSSPAGVDSWDDALEPFVSGRFTYHELSVNYRTPAEIMELADRILAVIEAAGSFDQPQLAESPHGTVTVRSTGEPVHFLPSGTDIDAVRTELEARGGLVAVVTADNVHDVKGLEYDHVIVDSPENIVDASPQGWQDLYVAVTRATQSLTVIGPLDLP